MYVHCIHCHSKKNKNNSRIEKTVKNNFLFIWIAGIFIILYPAFCLGQMYKYLDENQNPCFTDDLSKIPAEQRAFAERIPGNQSGDSPPVLPSDPEVQEVPIQAKTEEISSASNDWFEKEQGELVLMKRDLEAWYNKLKIRQEALSMDEGKDMSDQEILEHNQKLDLLRQDSEKYKRKEKEYLDKLSSYNLKADEFNKSSGQ